MKKNMQEGFKWSIIGHKTLQISYFQVHHTMLCGQWHSDCTMPQRGSVATIAVDVITFLENWFLWKTLIISMSRWAVF